MKTKIDTLLRVGSPKNNLLAFELLQSQEGMQAEEGVRYIIDYNLDNHKRDCNEIVIPFGGCCQVSCRLAQVIPYSRAGNDTYFHFSITQDGMVLEHEEFLIDERGDNWGPIGLYKREDFAPELEEINRDGYVRRIVALVK